MVCIYCTSQTEVTNSRFNKRTNAVWRRRACKSCGNIVSSYETVDLDKTWRVAQSKSRKGLKNFSRDKLLLSVYKSCAHRQTAVQDSSDLSKTIITQIAKRTPDGLLTTNIIATSIYDILKRFDQAAATHYKAFHPTSLSDVTK
jgi:transcriptional regulator NrdR family protein